MNHPDKHKGLLGWRTLAYDWIRGAAAKRATIVAVITWAATLVYGWPSGNIEIDLRIAAEQDGNGEVFYRSADEAFVQAHSTRFHVVGDGSPRDYAIELPVGNRIDYLRVDPFSGKGQATIHSLEIRDHLGVQRFTGQDLFQSRGRVNQARVGTDQDGHMLLHSVGPDPYFEFPLQRPVGEPRPLISFLKGIVTALSIGLLFTALEAGSLRAWHAFRRNRPAPSTIREGGITRLSLHLSDELLELTPSILVSFSLILAMALLYVGLKLHQSSIEVWENVYPYAPVQQAIDIGPPRYIRSDEWKVQTPWILNQAISGSPSSNPNLGGATAPLLASVPIAEPIGYPNLKYAGFRFLDIERGYSWFWAYKSFGLAFSFLWLLLILTRGHLPLSITGSAWIYFSSYTQWWFSSGLPEIMAAFAFGTTGALYLLYSNKRSMIAMGAALVAYAGANLALILYPPFIVSLGYLAIAIVTGYGIERKAIVRTQNDFLFRLSLGIVALAAMIGYGLWLHGAASTAIEAMLNTTYPGQRISSSGDVPISKVMGGIFEAFRIGEADFPRIPFSYNASEASGHVILLPFLVLLVPLRKWFQRDNALLLSIAGFCLLAFAWVCVQLPAPIDRTMQSGGWSLVTPKRAIMALGVGAIMLCVLLSARVRLPLSSTLSGRFHWIAIPLIAAAVVYFGWRLRQVDASFFSWQVITLGTLASLLILAGVARGKIGAMATGVAILALPAITVNPLTSGLSSVMGKPILVAAKQGGGAPGDRWMVIGDNFFAQGLKAVGLNAVAGTHYLPDRQFIDRLDPGHRYANVWNRYSTISMLSSPGIESPHFELIHPDQYRIAVDVCSKVVRDIGVTHVAYTVNVPKADLGCMQPVPSPEDSGVSLFRLSAQHADRPATP